MRTPRRPGRRPTHPGAILREDVLPALGITQAALAQRLGVSRLTVSELLLEKRALSPEMAARPLAAHDAGELAANAGGARPLEGPATPRTPG